MSEDALAQADRDLRKSDPDRWRTTLFARGALRARLIAVYAFNAEIARVRETVSEPMLGQIRLQWWREALDEIETGTKLRKHPVVLALAAARPELAPLRAAIDARERDLDDAPYASLDEMVGYARGVGGSISRAAFGQEHASAEPVGTAYALAGILRALPFFARQRRTPLPADLLDDAEITTDMLHENKAGPALRRVTEPIAMRALEFLNEARATKPPRGVFAAVLPGKVAALALKRLEQANYDPFDAALRRPAPADIWRLWLANSLRRF